MYKRSNDRRFQKNKRAIQRAFLDLVIEKGSANLSIAEITRKADINRMTFYSHYDTVEDVFREFVDDMEANIRVEIEKEERFDINVFFEILNSFMYQELDFFRQAARNAEHFDFRNAFKDSIARLIQINEQEDQKLDKAEQLVIRDLAAVCIAYSYLNWLAGDYGDMALDGVIKLTKDLLKDHLPSVSYSTLRR